MNSEMCKCVLSHGLVHHRIYLDEGLSEALMHLSFPIRVRDERVRVVPDMYLGTERILCSFVVYCQRLTPESLAAIFPFGL